MNFTWHINTLLPLGGVILSLAALALTIRLSRYSSKSVIVVFRLMMLAIAWWSLASFLENSGGTLTTRIFWLKAAYPGVVSLPVLGLIFAVQYSGGRKWLTRRVMALLAVLPAITLVMVLTNDIHYLLWPDIWLDSSVSPAVVAVTHGAWFWIHAAFSHALLLSGMVYLVRAFMQSEGIYRKQAGLLILAALIPWLGNAFFIAGAYPVYGFLISCR